MLGVAHRLSVVAGSVFGYATGCSAKPSRSGNRERIHSGSLGNEHQSLSLQFDTALTSILSPYKSLTNLCPYFIGIHVISSVYELHLRSHSHIVTKLHYLKQNS
jgi:hypothetical protein